MTRPTHYDPSIAGLARIVEVKLDELGLTIQKYRVLTHLSRDPGDKHGFQPSNVTWAHVPPIEGLPRKLPKVEKYERMAARALADLQSWLTAYGIAA